MAHIYLVHVGDDWESEFQETVSQPVQVGADGPEVLHNDQPVRVWGATEDNQGTKRDHFEEMKEDDLILFHDGDTVFATGYPKQKFDPGSEGPEVGEWLWDNPDSNLVFTLEEYDDDIAVPLEQIWRALGLQESYAQMYSYKRISDDAHSTLLEHFDSVEAFHQALQRDQLTTVLDGGQTEFPRPAAASYSESELGIDQQRWYYMKFALERYRQEVDWEEVKAGFERTAEAVKSLLRAYQSAGVFGNAEFDALKATLQTPSRIGAEATRERIQDSAGNQSELDHAAELVSEGTGIVGGIPYPVSTENTSEETLLGIFETLLDESADIEEVEAAAERFLATELENFGKATRTPLLCLLHPTRFPIVNQQSEKVFETCFDIVLSNTAEEYLESAEQFRMVRDEFGFDDHLRQLDYFCYWLREEIGPDDSPLSKGLRTRTVWQINVGSSDEHESEYLWPLWLELGICSVPEDIDHSEETAEGGLTDGYSVENPGTSENSEAEKYHLRLKRETEPGQIVIAKDGAELLGIGVTEQGGYQYCGDFLNDRIPETEIPHAHAWPVTWEVVPDEQINRDVGEWDIEPGLLPHKTPIVGTDAFEGIRWQLSKRDPGLIPALANLEKIVADPPESSLPAGFSDNTQTDQQYFILQTGDDKWEDEPAERYHFVMGNPGTRQLWDAGTAHVAYLEDGELYATAYISDIERKERGDEVHLYAIIENYEKLDPVDIHDVRGDFETQFSLQHSIIEINGVDYQKIIQEGTSTRYFWINSASEDWYHEDGTAFYKRTTSSGSPRMNQSVYERLRPGDKVVIYRNEPVGAIVGKGHVKGGLHKEPVEDRTDLVEGVNIAWDESIENVPMSQIADTEAFERTALVDSNNPYVITELSEQQYETVLELAGELQSSYFWVTANPSLWDVETAEEGTEIFYTATSEEGHKRNFYDDFEFARPGDEVLFYKSSPAQQIVAEGSVTEGLHEKQPEYQSEQVEGITLRYERSLDPVDWNTLKSLPELEGTKVIKNQAQGALISLPKPAYDAIKTASSPTNGDPFFIQKRVEELRKKLSLPQISLELPSGLYFESEDELLRQIEASLNSGKHIIFTGPPGTGKTKLAKHTSQRVVDNHSDIVDDYQFTTATAEWTTFDTIGGYVPNRTAEGDELVFQPRIFLDCFRSDGAVRNEWLVIDEINRSDIDKAFGQLFSVLSGDSVKLPYERESAIELISLDESDSELDDEDLKSIVNDPDTFPVTPSWRLLATMNTYDKTSLYELSYAFMRRFNFIHVGVPPLVEDGIIKTSLLRPGAEENYATAWLAEDEELREPLEETFRQLTAVWFKVNKQRTIGPSIVRDMLGYIAASETGAWKEPGPILTDAVIALVFPQLEGMAPKDQRSLIESLTDTDVPTEDGLVDLTLEGNRLERKAEDFFDLPPKANE